MHNLACIQAAEIESCEVDSCRRVDCIDPWAQFGVCRLAFKSPWLVANMSYPGVRIRGTLDDIDPLNKVPFQRAISRVKKGPLEGVSLILLRRTTIACQV